MRPYVRLILIGLIISFIGCGQMFALDIEAEFIEGFNNRCRKEIERTIWDSDFCIVGKVRVKEKQLMNKADLEEVPEGWEVDKIWRITGKIEIDSVVYGDPKVKQIPFSTIQSNMLPFGGCGPRNLPLGEYDCSEHDLWEHFLPEEDNIYIIIGKGEEKDTVVTKPIKRDNIKSIKSSAECFRTIKHLQGLKAKEFQKQREKLLLESNNIELLWYLFREGIRKNGMEGAISVMETLFGKGKVTPERKFISYLFALHIFAPPCIFAADGSCWKVYPPYRQYKNINASQRQRLNDIIIKSVSALKTIEAGIEHFRYLGSRILEQDADLKNSIKKITDNLSLQFKKHKDYSEWDKWVKKVFP